MVVCDRWGEGRSLSVSLSISLSVSPGVSLCRGAVMGARAGQPERRQPPLHSGERDLRRGACGKLLSCGLEI